MISNSEAAMRSDRGISPVAGFAILTLIPALALAAMMPAQRTQTPARSIATQATGVPKDSGSPEFPFAAVFLYDSGTPITDPFSPTCGGGYYPWWSTYYNTSAHFDLVAREFVVTPGWVATAFRIWWVYGSEGPTFACVNEGGGAGDFTGITLDLYADAGGSPGALLANLAGTWTTLDAGTHYKEYELATPYLFSAPRYFVGLRAETASPDYQKVLLWLVCAPGDPEHDWASFEGACLGSSGGWFDTSTSPYGYGFDANFGLQVVGYHDANVVDALPDEGCISTAHPCVEVDFDLTRFESTPMRGYSVTIQLSPELTLCSGVSSITQGDYLSDVGGTQFQVIDNDLGSYTVDCAILGLPCGATGDGTLFSADVKNSGGDGTGTITVTSAIARDCDNHPIAAGPGSAATLEIDNTPPGAVTALAASQDKTDNGSDGRTFIDLTFTAPGDVDLAGVEVYRAPFGTGDVTGSYPEYDDEPGAGPPSAPSYPPSAPWALTGVTASGQQDEPPVRGFWYYVAFAKDDCGNASVVSSMTGGTLDYHLGDVSDGVTDCAGNNLVNIGDISLLGAHYGSVIGHHDPANCLDVGPTSDMSVDGLPGTDNLIGFEDLIIFAINYGAVNFRGSEPAITDAGQAGSGEVDLRLAPRSRVVRAGDLVDVPVVLTGGAVDVRGIRTVVAYDAEVLSYEGSGVSERVAGMEHFFRDLASRERVDLNLATLGASLGGPGEVLWVRFRALQSGSLSLRLEESRVRDGSNRELLSRIAAGASGRPDPAASMAAQRPAAFRLGDAVPNPFNPRTTIFYELPEASVVSLAIYDVTGRVVRTLVDGAQGAGRRSVEWDGTNDEGRPVESGIYFYVMRAGGYESQRRMTLLK
jgi:hypothetical protein